ncbi:site-specific DNA-methyltransferase [Flavobacterium litorale]|uniref:site-specific DNA-methyltransferase (adenine-specific) n=1 Tax=Flavobacterium litorale TaxID=2856519 RepID=A0ABX8V7H6_9FLAO|nr:site-specific DNA-methyltransferase [Flavobacterium litorale]QYJ68808.1 site-specific DNA-methyltransferase [Flavobacterium litorale]
MDGKSLSPEQSKLEQLREILPEAFTEGKIDWEKLKATLGEDINFSNERYVLNWAGKSDAFKILQHPTTSTLVPAKEESVNFDTTENIFIEGENLEVLKVLQKSYFGKVKMIYIDPPYNTGSDSFIYPDKFAETREEYAKRVGDKDDEGYMTKDGLFNKNSKENGQYHSNWLNMMYPRLFLAKNLLKQDGVIFISIDDNEVHNLRLLMNEVFGEENFMGQISRLTGTPTGQGTNSLVSELDYILVYAKSPLMEFIGLPLTSNEQSIYNQKDEYGNYLTRPLRKTGGEDRRQDRPSMYFSIEDPNGNEVFPIGPTGYDSRWRCSRSKYDEFIKDNLIEWKQTKTKFEKEKSWKPYLKFYLEGRLKQASNLWKDIDGNKKASVDLKNLMDTKLFDFPKPIELIKKCIEISIQDENDIILDFFSGSGTTGHAVMDLNKEDDGNRKYICVQLPELCDEKSEAYKAGYATIADIAKERIRRAANKIKEENPDYKGDLGFKVLKLENSNFKQWQQVKENDPKALEKQMKMFVDPVAEGATIENIVYELLLKSGKDLNSTIEHKNDYYCINDNELVLMLEKATQDVVDNIIKEQPQKVIALDKLFEGNDQLKTNTVLQMKDAGIEFKTI